MRFLIDLNLKIFNLAYIFKNFVKFKMYMRCMRLELAGSTGIFYQAQTLKK